MDDRRDEPPRPRPGLFEEMEKLARRARAIPLAAPVVLVAAIGFGRLTAGWLGMPGEAEPAGVELAVLAERMHELRATGERTADYVVVYRDHVAPVEEVLVGRGLSDDLARQVAWPLVEHAYRSGLDPATVVAVMLIESSGRPTATSAVGARGLMQVMPLHVGHWRECGRDLYAIDDNLCHGTRILAWYLDRFDGDERRALLGYNGCIRGTACREYPLKVERLREQIRTEWELARIAPSAAAP